MDQNTNTAKLTDKLPDVALENSRIAFPAIDWVGMKGIEVPVLWEQGGQSFRLPAKADAFVSLDKKAARGIHMSRLYLHCQKYLSERPMSFSLLGELVQEFLKSHEDLSQQARCSVAFDLPLIRSALKSDNSSWRTYPLTLRSAVVDGELRYYAQIKVTYSSTCPASAALSRQLIQEAFDSKFKNQTLDFSKIYEWLGTTQGIVATPHAQRSIARILVEVKSDFDLIQLIDVIEDSLQTAVQGAVKRVDEQEFALRNGQNLMFCEDAARRVKAALDSLPLNDYYAQFDHIESLHPHSAVSEISMGKALKGFLDV